jgi:hypothetical protein
VTLLVPPGVAAVAVSLIYGCALQAVIAPGAVDVQQQFDTAVRMLDGPGRTLLSGMVKC